MRHRDFEDTRADHCGLDHHLHRPAKRTILHVEGPQQIRANGS